MADLVYSFTSGGYFPEAVVFAERERVERVARIRKALEESRTWGEFRANLPEGEWEDHFLASFDEPPEELLEEFGDDEPFDADKVPGYSDGNYPPWLAQDQLRWFPPKLIKKYGGEEYETMFDGSSLELPADKIEQIAADLRAMGHTVEHCDDEIY